MRDTFLRLYFTVGSLVYALSWRDVPYLVWAGLGFAVAVYLLWQDYIAHRRQGK